MAQQSVSVAEPALRRDLRLALDRAQVNFDSLFGQTVRSSEYPSTAAGLSAAAAAAIAGRKRLVIQKGDYTLSTTFGIPNVNADLEVECEPNARLIAAPGFPSGHDLVQFTGGAGCRLVWRGGFFDGRNIPVSGVGQSNDVVSFNVSGAKALILEDMEIEAGDNWLSGGGTLGSDSCLFAGWAKQMSLRRLTVRGAPDAGIYLSGGSTGDGSAEFTESLSFDEIVVDSCLAGMIVKRRFRRVAGGRVFVSDCATGLTLGGEGSFTAANDDLQAEDISVQSVIARRTETACVLRFVENAHVGSIIARDLGASVGGYVSTVGRALHLQGARRCTVGSVIAEGENVPVTSTAVMASSRGPIDGETRHSTDNIIGPITSININRSVSEDDANQDRNVYLVASEQGVTSQPAIKGANSVLQRPSKAPVVLASSAVAIAHTGTTTPTSLASVTVPASAMGPNGRLRVTYVVSVTNSANNKTLRIKFGGSAYNSVTLTTSASLRQQAEICNRNSESSQICMAAVAGGFGASTGAVVTAALNTTAARTLEIEATLANAAETITLESYTFELIHGA